jgi:hypothetical protein
MSALLAIVPVGPCLCRFFLFCDSSPAFGLVCISRAEEMRREVSFVMSESRSTRLIIPEAQDPEIQLQFAHFGDRDSATAEWVKVHRAYHLTRSILQQTAGTSERNINLRQALNCKS